MFQTKLTNPPNSRAAAERSAAPNASGIGFDFLIIVFAAVFLAFVVLKRFKTAKTGNTGGDQHGTAGFAGLDEFAHFTTELLAGELKIGKVKDLGIFTRLVKLPKPNALQHTLIAAPTGVGKSRSFFLPNCYAAGRSSFIVTDPKGEIFDLTAFKQRNPVRFAPADPDNSAGFNFLLYCKDVDGAESCAEALVSANGSGTGDSFWELTEQMVLTALFLHIAHTDVPTPAHAYELLQSGAETICQEIENSNTDAARLLLGDFVNLDQKGRGFILTALSAKLRFLANPQIRRFTGGSLDAFDFGRLKDKPTQVYWCLEEDDVAKLQGLTAVFFATAMRQMVKNKSRKVHVNLFFDEFANIGKIKNFQKKIAILRGQGIALSAGLQSVAQLEEVYGPAPAKTILENFVNVLILDSLKQETAEAFSKALGEYTYAEETESVSSGGGGILSSKATKSRSHKTHTRRLMTADEIRRLSKKKTILLSGNLRPILVERPMFATKPEEEKKAAAASLAKFKRTNQPCGREIPAPRYSRRITPEAKKEKLRVDDV